MTTPDSATILDIALGALRQSNPELQVVVTRVAGLESGSLPSGTGMVISSDQAGLGQLATEGVTYQPVPFIRTLLQIVVAPGNPLAVTTVADLQKPGVKTALVSTSTLTGQAQQHLLGADGVQLASTITVATPAEAVAAVASGQANASLLEIPDVDAAGSQVRAFDIPTSDNVVTEFAFALPKPGPPGALAEALAAALLAGSASQALVSAHYLLPLPVAPSNSGPTPGEGS